jgi:hypothetical protein
MKLDRILMVITTLATYASMALASNWTPPDNPDPQSILQEAQSDARAMRYELALAKHVWFHENALKFDQARSGLRLSCALSYWKSLGRDYPPALDKLRKIRDTLADQVKEGMDIGSGFHDLAAINKTLDEESKTTGAFKILVEKNPGAAERAFPFVKPALIKDKEYSLYVKYVDCHKDYLRMKQMYEMSSEMAKDPKFGTQLLDHANISFRNNAATLVAILSVNDRKMEASEIAVLAKGVLGDSKFHEELEAALAGAVPAPWP